ncbi:MAG TPA: hypothetical protein PKO33_11785, partial [Pyrinomonadaceae bacterium]|nr:hypothetical protein [Pyrinomonadaceae bacterium]
FVTGSIALVTIGAVLAYSADSAENDITDLYVGLSGNPPIYDREKLKPGNRIAGPAIITQKDSTTVILPDHHGKVDEYLNILIYADQ